MLLLLEMMFLWTEAHISHFRGEVDDVHCTLYKGDLTDVKEGKMYTLELENDRIQSQLRGESLSIL